MLPLLLGVVSAAPHVVVSFDNGGFNLPLYTNRWNGIYEQPSVARQLMADLSRTLNRTPRVFTYLPPGHVAGRSSDPHEVLPRPPGCTSERCPCPPGEACWSGLNVNRDPAASTSLFQTATALRERVGPGPRFEIHFTDLFEEDPVAANDPADADRCVTAASTRRALEALLTTPSERLTHLAVGRLVVPIPPPRRPAGGATRFVPADAGCWTARRLRTFGGEGPPFLFEMGVLIAGYETDADDAVFQQLVNRLPRQLAAPLQLELVVVREPPHGLELPPTELHGERPTLALPPLPARLTPCNHARGIAEFHASNRSIRATVDGASCDGGGILSLDPTDLRAAFRAHASLDPRVHTLDVTGTAWLTGDRDSVLHAIAQLGSSPTERPLPFWSSLREAVDTTVIPRNRWYELRIHVVGIDPRPWGWALAAGFAMTLLVGFPLHRALARHAANRAYRQYMYAEDDLPLATVLQAATDASRRGWLGRVLLSAAVALAAGALVAVLLLLTVDLPRG